jgi:ribosomal protein L16 Arg81 hydroxylase
MNFKEWFKRNILGRKPEVATPEPYVGPDELAERLANEANDLFRTVQAKRTEAAQVLETAAEQAREQANNLQLRAEAALKLAAERANKAAQSSKIAAKLDEFIS